MDNCKPTPTPFLSGVNFEAKCSTPLIHATLYHLLVRSLIYLTHTHLGNSFVFNMVLRFMQEPHELHYKDTKCFLHYIQGTHHFGIHYVTSTRLILVGYIDSNWVGNLDDHKSTSGYNFHLGFGPICWQS